MSVVLIAGGVLLSLLFRESVEKNMDARLSVLLDNLIGVSNVANEGIISLYRAMVDPRFDQPYSGWYWQISEKGQPPFRSRSLWDQDLQPDLSIVNSRPHFYSMEGPDRQQLRVIERDIILPDSNRIFRFMVAADKSEIADAVAQFNRTLLIWLLLLGGGLIAAMVIQVRYGLQPLRRLRKSLSRIRGGEQKRLDDDFPSEVMPLVSELNALLSHNEMVVERAQTHVGNLAHSLKTPLTVLSNEAALQPGSALAQAVIRQTAAMSRHVNHHLVRARAVARGSVIGSRTAVEPALADLKRALDRIYAARHLDLTIEDMTRIDPKQKPPVEGLAFRGERQDLDEMLGNLMDNACKWARRKVLVRLRSDKNNIVVTIEDDGPGIAPQDRAHVFGRGERVDESVPGTGLGLAIVRDIAALCGGSIELDESALGGLKAILILPTA